MRSVYFGGESLFREARGDSRRGCSERARHRTLGLYLGNSLAGLHSSFQTADRAYILLSSYE